MSAFVDLEIGLHRRNVDYYEVRLRLSRADDDADLRLHEDDPQLVQLDLENLRSLEMQDIDYGQELSRNLQMHGVISKNIDEPQPHVWPSAPLSQRYSESSFLTFL